MCIPYHKTPEKDLSVNYRVTNGMAEQICPDIALVKTKAVFSSYSEAISTV